MPDGTVARRPLRIGLPAEITTVELECARTENTDVESSVEFRWPGDRGTAFEFTAPPDEIATFKPGRVYVFSISEKSAGDAETRGE